MIKTYEFPTVTLLITHYNRSSSLENLLTTFQRLNCRFGDIVVSDDGSKEPHQHHLNQLKEIFSFQLITTPVNRGLGNNINKGQDAVKTPYTLYVQEDFEPTSEFPDKFVDALTIFDQQPQFDIIRFYAYMRYPYLKPFTEAFSEMFIPIWAINYKKLYFYSDHPHLRRSSFLEKFGRYVEGIHPDQTEYRMSISFIQKKGKGLFYNHYKQLFDQKNSQEEPSTIHRKRWTFSKNPFIATYRYLYRHLKFNYDIHFMRP
ncbi:glycosyltransferase [Spirosoma sp. HMF3257]|uniref:Glycosyl transferase family 2 n=1 Tax=Spirosoma telluris TaxID=2183553 RepID=A0A327NFY4_9BACT|nr:glycosyltransferase [Spirosoma telluris]RAI74067.1 glycosyl transferase family 2 [Spirosoma telluris]